MPNWCFNSLRIDGDPKEIRRFKLIAAKKTGPEEDRAPLAFEKFVPMPKELEGTPSLVEDTPERIRLREKYGAADWYEWSIRFWGTKWGPSDPEITEETDTSLTYHFDTPWGPPQAWLEAVGTQFPTLSFEMYYEEPGMGFAGKIRVHDDAVEEEELPLPEEEDDFDLDELTDIELDETHATAEELDQTDRNETP